MVSRWELLLCSGDLEAAPSASRCVVKDDRPPDGCLQWAVLELSHLLQELVGGDARPQPSSTWASRAATMAVTAWTAVLSWCPGPGGGGHFCIFTVNCDNSWSSTCFPRTNSALMMSFPPMTNLESSRILPRSAGQWQIVLPWSCWCWELGPPGTQAWAWTSWNTSAFCWNHLI
jgi:hypothetical protein